MNVNYSATAREDIRSIYEYIAFTLEAPDSAERLVSRIVSAADSLAFMPQRYRLCDIEPWKSMNIRMMAVGKYLLFYSSDEDAVTVERVMYGGRDYSSMTVKQ